MVHWFTETHKGGIKKQSYYKIGVLKQQVTSNLQQATSKPMIIKTFERYLILTGYAESTIYSSINGVKEFLFWLDKQEITDIETIKKPDVENYFEYLKNRKKIKTDGNLSSNSLTANLNALKRFDKYLKISGKQGFETDIKLQSGYQKRKEILSPAEIKSLYKACDTSIYGSRDRAILSIFYGCGLRRNEAQTLDIENVILKDDTIFVNKAKGYKERYVPISKKVKQDLENYMFTTRETLKKQANQKAFFLNYKGNRLSGNGLYLRLKILQQRALPDKQISLHSLRHAIATHLLSSGMSLENVGKFLGHASLETTQIYTHLINE